jgi:WD40 repeat protein
MNCVCECIHNNNNSTIVVSSESHVKIFTKKDEADYSVDKQIDVNGNGTVTSLASSGNTIVTAKSDHSVYSHNVETQMNNQLIKRLTNEITHLQFNSRYGQLLAICSREDSILVQDLEKEQGYHVEHSSVQGGYFTCNFDPQGKYLAAISIDHSVVIWSDVTSQEAKQITVLTHAVSKDINKSWSKAIGSDQLVPFTISWYPHGKYLAMPSKNKNEIQILPRDSWKKPIVLRNDNIGTYPYIVKYSPNGLYLLIVSTDQITILALDPKTQQMIGETVAYYCSLDESVVLAAEWCHNSDQIVLVCIDYNARIILTQII